MVIVVIDGVVRGGPIDSVRSPGDLKLSSCLSVPDAREFGVQLIEYHTVASVYSASERSGRFLLLHVLQSCNRALWKSKCLNSISGRSSMVS